MPRLHRFNRALQRLFTLLVILAGFYGWWYASTHWQFDLTTWSLPNLTEDQDWIELIAGLLETAIQVFLSLTGTG